MVKSLHSMIRALAKLHKLETVVHTFNTSIGVRGGDGDGGRGRGGRIRNSNSRSSSATAHIKTSLGYMRPCLKKEKDGWRESAVAESVYIHTFTH